MNRTIFANWIGGPAIGALVVLFLQTSGCSNSAQPLPPLDTSSQSVVQSYLADKPIEKVDLRGVEFRRDGSIRPDSTPVLESAVEVLNSKPNATVYVDSYCDPRGGAELNQKISEARAAAVANYLKEHGVPANHIVARGFGASNFVASNSTGSGRAQNRRIELVIQSNTDDPNNLDAHEQPLWSIGGDRLVSR